MKCCGKSKYLLTRQITTIFLCAFAVYSCGVKSSDGSGKRTSNFSAADIAATAHSDSLAPKSDQSTAIAPELSAKLAEAVSVFPDDSASLYRFYAEWNATKDHEETERHVKRLDALISKESVDRYRLVKTSLKPLLTDIVQDSSITKIQADSVVMLYCDYDFFSGESLFSRLLSNDDNYKLVWKSFGIMSREAKGDTCFISALVRLDACITTNVELGEAMPSFIVKAIANNPEGFLDMYTARKREMQPVIASYVSVYDQPDEKLMALFRDISSSSQNASHRKAAADLLRMVENAK